MKIVFRTLSSGVRFLGILTLLACCPCACHTPVAADNSPRHETLLETGWTFSRDSLQWEPVTVPHDWAIYGPFDSGYDAQTVAISQNFETQETLKTGRTGGLPYTGKGWYKNTFDVPGFDPSQKVTLLFDGAMSQARVKVNGIPVAYRPYGYVSFHCDITAALHPDGKGNLLEVSLENQPQSSRWYPGTGLYRNVHLITTRRLHIPVWGTQITTSQVSAAQATVHLVLTVALPREKAPFGLHTALYDPDGRRVAQSDTCLDLQYSPDSLSATVRQEFTVTNPQRWSPETPALYRAETQVYEVAETPRRQPTDRYTTRFGIRTVELLAHKGFYLNGTLRKFQGVCNHHDLGPLGAAINTAALRHQLTLLKEMGCDAIRTSHNMPAPELVALCDQMGFMMIIEPFDEWDIAKCRNGYHQFFAQWAEQDMVNMLHQYRNNPSVVMWSIGNEVPGQCEDSGRITATFLRDICHREDPTRPVTCGMDQVACTLENGFAALLDVPGLNYRVPLYRQAYDLLPQKLVLGSETASTVSSRGVYHFPVTAGAGVIHPDNQSSSYDLESCWWSNLPDLDFSMAADYPWTIGQFVWTGFDYLGEPTPYDSAWPNHSSMFGIFDLASLPKDRYYLYRSVWNPSQETLHILPHWNWEGREGQTTPVYVYTNYPQAELFVNGISQGRRSKNDSTLQHRYRLMWNDVVYQPGTLRVVAYDVRGREVAQKQIVTAGAPHHLSVSADRTRLEADGRDLAYLTVSVVDKDGNLCPADNRLIHFEVEGAGTFRAAANGDPTCLDLFHQPQMHAFGGQLTAIVQTAARAGRITFTASAPGLDPASLTLAGH